MLTLSIAYPIITAALTSFSSPLSTRANIPARRNLSSAHRCPSLTAPVEASRLGDISNVVTSIKGDISNVAARGHYQSRATLISLDFARLLYEEQQRTFLVEALRKSAS